MHLSARRLLAVMITVAIIATDCSNGNAVHPVALPVNKKGVGILPPDDIHNKDFTVRLVGCNNVEARQAGRIEVSYRGVWGTVCGDSFTNEAARVACYSLGYARGGAINLYQTFGPPANSQMPIHISGLDCAGTENHLDWCYHMQWGNASSACTHNMDIGVACDPNGETYGYATRLVNDKDGDQFKGRLEIFYNDTWGSVCDWNFDNVDATVACKSMFAERYPTINFAGRFIGYDYGYSTGMIWLSLLDCTGSELNIGNCPHAAWGITTCNNFNDVSIECYPDNK